MVGAVLELSSSWVSSALSAPLQKPLFPVISMLTWNTKFRVNLPKFGPKTGPEIGSKKGFKTRPKWVFQFWPPFWSQFWAQFGFQFWSQFWPQFWVRFWSQFWAHFGSKASKETRSGAKMVPEAMRKCGDKGASKHLQVFRHARVTFNLNLPKMPPWSLRKISTFAFWTFEIASSKTFHRYCIAQRICWSACRAVLDLLIQVTSLLGWCSLRRFKSARTRETQPGCLKESFSQIIW